MMAGVILLFGLPTSVPVSAASINISLTDALGGTNTSLVFNNIYPGQSDSKVVKVSNNSTESASLLIWLDSFVNTAGKDGTADLADNLQFSVSGSGLTAANFPMPGPISGFPMSASSPKTLTVPAINPGDTVTLTWRWYLPLSGGSHFTSNTDNIVQGDGISFDVNYQLSGTGAPPTTPEPEPNPIPTPPSTPNPPGGGDRFISLVMPQAGDQSRVTADGIVIGGLKATVPDGSFTLDILQGTQVHLSNENRQYPVDLSKVGETVPWEIRVTNPDVSEVPPYPDGWIPVSPNYDINGVTNGYITGVKLDRPSTLIIKYNDKLLPETVDDLAAFYYSYQDGWTELSPPAGFIAEGPEVAAEVDHFSLFVVLAKSGAGKPPANIMLQRLTVRPQRILVGQSADVRVRVINKGGLPGEYVVVIKVDGKIQKSQSVHLNPGQSTEVDMILMPGTSGIYTVTAGPLGDELWVDPRIIPDVSETNYWWLLCIAAGISTMIISLFRSRRQLQEAEATQTTDKE